MRLGGNRISTVFMTDKILMENSFCPSHELILRLHLSLAADIVLLPWDMDEPYGHADGMVAPLPDGRLLLNNYCQTAKGNKIDYYKRLLKMIDGHFPFVELSYDCKLEEDSWCYLMRVCHNRHILFFCFYTAVIDSLIPMLLFLHFSCRFSSARPK